MRRATTLIAIPLVVAAVAGSTAFARPGPAWTLQNTGVTARLRGLAAVSARVAWASGTEGTVLRTVDAGRTWRRVGPAGTTDLQFRDIEAFDADHAVALSIGAGDLSRVYVTGDGGRTWAETFRNDDPAAFYDCMAFFDRRHGLALSDPVGGKFRVLSTADGGRHWRVLPSEGMPAALDGEFAFAASGTCLVTARSDDRAARSDDRAAGSDDRAAGSDDRAAGSDDRAAGSDDRAAWFATGGGAAARVFRSTDRGATWAAVATPVPSGPTAGIYSLAFRDRRHGLAVGGDFTTPTTAPNGAATSRDGGVTWIAAKTVPGEYRSGVAWLPATDRAALAVGPTGSDISYDAGRTWVRFDTGSFDAVACAGRGSWDGGCWASGEHGRVARLRWGQ